MKPAHDCQLVFAVHRAKASNRCNPVSRTGLTAAMDMVTSIVRIACESVVNKETTEKNNIDEYLRATA
jgi:hypothetical protein